MTYRSPAIDNDSEKGLLEPHETLSPQMTLNPCIFALPHTTLLPERMLLAPERTLLPKTMLLPQMILLPQIMLSPQTILLPNVGVFCIETTPLAGSTTTVGESARPIATSVLLRAAHTSRYPAPTVNMSYCVTYDIPVCGSTGEDYAEPFENAIVCDTDDPLELATYLRRLFEDPQLAHAIRERAAQTARRYLWPAVFDMLDVKIGYLAHTRN